MRYRKEKKRPVILRALDVIQEKVATQEATCGQCDQSNCKRCSSWKQFQIDRKETLIRVENNKLDNFDLDGVEVISWDNLEDYQEVIVREL